MTYTVKYKEKHGRGFVRVISKRKIREYSDKNAQAKVPLAEWYGKMIEFEGNNLTELRMTFNSADPVNGYTVFNIGGNNYRLITAIHYNTKRCYIRTIWSHAEYSKAENKLKLKRGEL
jgi:mRNA interferase HigB